MKKRIFALAMVCFMLVSMLPVNGIHVHAADDEPEWHKEFTKHTLEQAEALGIEVDTSKTDETTYTMIDSICGEPGAYLYKCPYEDCVDWILGESFVKPGSHKPEQAVTAKDPQCENKATDDLTDGYIAHYKCVNEGCSQLFVKDENGVAYKADITREYDEEAKYQDGFGIKLTAKHNFEGAMCGDEGTRKCTDCGKVENPSKEHSWNPVPVNVETIGTDMYGIFECDECGKRTDKIPVVQNCPHNVGTNPANGSVMNKVEAKPADCLNPGHIEHYHCTACNSCFADQWGMVKLTKEQVETPAKGHTAPIENAIRDNSLYPLEEASCGKDGSYWAVCTDATCPNRKDQKGLGDKKVGTKTVHPDKLGSNDIVNEEDNIVKMTIKGEDHTWALKRHDPTCTMEAYWVNACTKCGVDETNADGTPKVLLHIPEQKHVSYDELMSFYDFVANGVAAAEVMTFINPLYKNTDDNSAVTEVINPYTIFRLYVTDGIASVKIKGGWIDWNRDGIADERDTGKVNQNLLLEAEDFLDEDEMRTYVQIIVYRGERMTMEFTAVEDTELTAQTVTILTYDEKLATEIPVQNAGAVASQQAVKDNEGYTPTNALSVNNGIVGAKFPTCEKDGQAVYTCPCCEKIISEVLPRTGHSGEKKQGEVVTVQPNCTLPGYQFTICTNPADGCEWETKSTLEVSYNKTSYAIHTGTLVDDRTKADDYCDTCGLKEKGHPTTGTDICVKFASTAKADNYCDCCGVKLTDYVTKTFNLGTQDDVTKEGNEVSIFREENGDPIYKKSDAIVTAKNVNLKTIKGTDGTVTYDFRVLAPNETHEWYKIYYNMDSCAYEGTMIYVCPLCNETDPLDGGQAYPSDKDQPDHEWEPTCQDGCTNDAAADGLCDKCGREQGESHALLYGHGFVDTTEADDYCDVCHAYIGADGTANGIVEIVQEYEACKSDLVAKIFCYNCKKVHEVKLQDKGEHAWSEWTEKTSCLVGTYKDRTCSNCQAYESVVLEAYEHNPLTIYGTVAEADTLHNFATWTAGMVADGFCDVCDKKLDAHDGDDHDYIDLAKVYRPASCNLDQILSYECLDCKAAGRQPNILIWGDEAVGHTFCKEEQTAGTKCGECDIIHIQYVGEQKASCLIAGHDEYGYCTTCKTTVTLQDAQKGYEAMGHDYVGDKSLVWVDPTCGMEGASIYFACQREGCKGEFADPDGEIVTSYVFYGREIKAVKMTIDGVECMVVELYNPAALAHALVADTNFTDEQNCIAVGYDRYYCTNPGCTYGMTAANKNNNDGNKNNDYDELKDGMLLNFLAAEGHDMTVANCLYGAWCKRTDCDGELHTPNTLVGALGHTNDAAHKNDKVYTAHDGWFPSECVAFKAFQAKEENADFNYHCERCCYDAKTGEDGYAEQVVTLGGVYNNGQNNSDKKGTEPNYNSPMLTHRNGAGFQVITQEEGNCLKPTLMIYACVLCGAKHNVSEEADLEHSFVPEIDRPYYGNPIDTECEHCGIAGEPILPDEGGLQFLLSVDNAMAPGAGYTDSSLVKVTVSLESFSKVSIHSIGASLGFSSYNLYFLPELTNFLCEEFNFGTLAVEYDENDIAWINIVASACDENGNPIDVTIDKTTALVELFFRVDNSNYPDPEMADEYPEGMYEKLMGNGLFAFAEAFDEDDDEPREPWMHMEALKANGKEVPCAGGAAQIEYKQFMDGNGNGRITLEDLLEAVEIMQGNKEYDVVLDVNQNGKIQLDDVLALYNYYAGAISYYDAWMMGCDEYAEEGEEIVIPPCACNQELLNWLRENGYLN